MTKAFLIRNVYLHGVNAVNERVGTYLKNSSLNSLIKNGLVNEEPVNRYL